MTNIEIKARKWQVLAVPTLAAFTAIYFIGAWYASSLHPSNVIDEIMSQGYPLIILVLAAAQFFFLEFAEGRLTQLVFNDVGIQASYFNDESKWTDWDDIMSVKKSPLKLSIISSSQNVFTIPLLKFSASDRKLILRHIEQNASISNE